MNQSSFGSNFVSTGRGLNNNNTKVYNQPNLMTELQTYNKTYDYQWAEKKSSNGKFKYGLFECCSGPNGCCYSTILFLPFGCIPLARINGELARVIGKIIISNSK